MVRKFIKSKKKLVGLNSSRVKASVGQTAPHAPHVTQVEKLIAGILLVPIAIAFVGQTTSHLLHSLSTLKERTHFPALRFSIYALISLVKYSLSLKINSSAISAAS